MGLRQSFLGGIRHCDVVAVTQNGAELLTPLQSKLEELILPAGVSLLRSAFADRFDEAFHRVILCLDMHRQRILAEGLGSHRTN